MIDSTELDNNEVWSKPKTRVSKPKVEKADSSSTFSSPFIDGNKKITKNFNKNSYTNNSNSSSFNKTFNSSKQPNINLFLLKEWAGSGLNTDALIYKYNLMKSSVENENYLCVNITNVFDRLAQNWRHDVIKVLRETNSNYAKKDYYNRKGGTPFHKMLYPNPKISDNLDENKLDDFIKTFNEFVLLKFNIFSFNHVEIENETFLMCLSNPPLESPISEQHRNLMYKYITETFNNFDYYDDCFCYILNMNMKTDFTCDKILYILHKYPEAGTKKLINWMCSMQFDDIGNGTNVDIINVIDAIMLTPKPKTDFYNYLINYDLDTIRNNFINIVLENGLTWIDEWLQKKLESNYNTLNEFDKNYKNQVYNNLMIFYGKFYSYKLQNNQILDSINNFLNLNLFCKVTAVSYFITNSKIDLSNPNLKEKDFIIQFLDNLKKSKNTTRIKILNSFSSYLNNPNITMDEIYKFGN